MSETVLSFLRYLKSSYLKGFANTSPLKIVCGNQSADLDSVVSAISFAYFSYLKDPRNPILPVVNIPRNDLDLRRDIVSVLKRQSIPKNLLYFQEDIRDLKRQFGCKVESILVDHNDPQSDLKLIIDRVIGIIDHHEDLGLYKEEIAQSNGPRIITTTGSCSSLVLNYWYDLIGPESVAQMKDSFPLCLGAALIDTSNFKFKVEEADLKVLGIYKKYLPEVNFEEYYKQIREAKDDISGFSLKSVLKKDYKEFVFDKSSSPVRCGIASVVKPLSWLRQEYGIENIDHTCSELLKEQSQDIFLILTSFIKENTFLREIAFFAHPDTIHLCDEIISQVSPALKLKPIDEVQVSSENCLKAFDQLNVSASRKQIAPCIERAVRSL